jgi:hypothetical protein
LGLLAAVACGVVLYFAQQDDDKNKDNDQLIVAFSITACALAFVAAVCSIAEYCVWAFGPLPAALLDGKSVVPIWNYNGKKLLVSPPGTKWSLNTNTFRGMVFSSLFLIFCFVVMLIIGVKKGGEGKKKRNGQQQPQQYNDGDDNIALELRKELLKDEPHVGV